MHRCLPLFFALVLTTPALAQEGVFVWNDPADLAIRMITFNAADPSQATAAMVLTELKTISSTMTAVSSDGAAIGLCHQVQDGNEAPAALHGYDHKGREIWMQPASAYLEALKAALPKDLVSDADPNWFTFGCQDGGAADRPGVLAFDVQFSAAPPKADGTPDWARQQDLVGRLHVDGQTGRPLAAAILGRSAQPLVLARNPVAAVYTDSATGKTYQLGNDPAFQLPPGGRGQVTWSDRAIRWKGKPVVNGFDFAWYLPQRP